MGNGHEGSYPVSVDVKRKDVRDLLNGDELKKQFELALPKVCTVERFVRVALTAVNKTPKLLDCTRESLLACLYGCAELGLEPDGRRAHLIPYGDKCTLIIDYKGKVELAMRAGTVANIHADKICDNDVFEFNKGEIVRHSIDFSKDRGKPYAYYCLVRMKDGTEKAEVMTLAEVEAVRKRSKAANNGPWVTDFDEMGKKTVFHRASKWITLSPELRRAEELDDDRLDPALEVPHLPNKNDVSAPRALSDLNAIEKQYKREYDELIDLSSRSSKKTQENIKAFMEGYCTETNKTPEEFGDADFEAIIPKIREALR